jgi:DNA-binding NarL/FixJ family response regulator
MIAFVFDLAAWLVHTDDPLRAAMLVGASDRIRATGFVRTPYDARLHAQVMNDLEARVYQHELASARKQGDSLTIEQILDLLGDKNMGSSAHDSQLSDREMEILRLMSQGMSKQADRRHCLRVGKHGQAGY